MTLREQIARALCATPDQALHGKHRGKRRWELHLEQADRVIGIMSENELIRKLIKVREWIRAEIGAKIADSQPGSDGYTGGGYAENREAEKLFLEVIKELRDE